MPYPDFEITWIVDGILAAAMRPSRPEDFDAVAACGIRTVICLKETPHRFAESRARGMRPVHIPVADFAFPDREAIDEFLETIDGGPPALVHCHAGLGRTGTLCAAYLILRRGFAPEAAIAAIRALRPGSIESPGQEAGLLALA